MSMTPLHIIVELAEKSLPYDRARRGKQFEKKLKEFLPQVDAPARKRLRDTLMAIIVEGLVEVDLWIMVNNSSDGQGGWEVMEGAESLFVMDGSDPCFAHLAIVDFLTSRQMTVDVESTVWKAVKVASGR